MRERKPTFGRRFFIGIWPPSKPGLILPLPARANEPLWPRPAVLPRPEPMPRPTRLRSVRAPSAGLRVLSFMRFFSLGRTSGLDADQVMQLVDEATDGRRVLQLAHVVDLAQAEGLHRQAVALLAAAQTLDQAHTDGGGGVLVSRALINHG